MYSYEDRIRAVELYIKLGLRSAATICQLGYPTKNALRSWYREYRVAADLTRSYVRAKAKYSQAQMDAAVEHYLEHGRCIAFTIEALGYPCRDSLRSWVRDADPDRETRNGSRSPGPTRPPAVKKAAVVALCMRQGSAEALAEEFGVCRPTLYQWKNDLLGPEQPASMTSRRPPLRSLEREELERQLQALQRDVYCLQLEHDLLKKANEIIKKDLGINRQTLTNREKAMLVDALKQTYPVAELLETLMLARSSYFYHRAKLRVAEKYTEVRLAMADIFERNHRCYGYRRMRAALSRQCLHLSEKVIRRLMTQGRLVIVKPKRQRYGSYLGEISPAPENLVDRNFKAAAPNEKWLTDISEFQIAAGKVYLSPIIDCFDGQVVSWSIGTSPDANLVNTMLDSAIETIADTGQQPVVHSDRGAHYRWPGWLSRIANAKLIRSMSRKGCSPDNAACEGFFGRLKTEMFYPGNWRSTTIDQFIQALNTYIHWYNTQRIKISLGALSPNEYRKSLGLLA